MSGGDSVALGVEIGTDFESVAGLLLFYVLIHGTLDEEGVLAVAGPHSRYALFVLKKKHRSTLSVCGMLPTRD